MVWRRHLLRAATSAARSRNPTCQPFSAAAASCLQHPIRTAPLSSSPLALPVFHYQGVFLTTIHGFQSPSRRRLSIQACVTPPGGAVVDVPLAQTGEGIVECELLKWFVREGDHVEEFQCLCEVQSDKATIEITSRVKGKVQQLLYNPGDIVKVGETLLRIYTEENGTLLASDILDAATLHPPEIDSLVGQSPHSSEMETRSVLSTPAVRHFAKHYGLDINDINGSGKDGRVSREDVLRYAVSKGICIGDDSSSNICLDDPGLIRGETIQERNIPGGHYYEDKKVPIRGFHRSMVKSMTMAVRVPHFHYLEEINCDALVELKEAFENANMEKGVKYTFLPILIKSLSMALNKHPLLNSSFTEESNEVILKGSHNIGVAMATSYGLVVPNIKTVQSLSIIEITKELTRLQALASHNKLSSEDITGGTITLSNIGAIGGKFGSPLLNLPEVAIIAIGRIQKLPQFADDGTIYSASVTNINIGADHRVVDGATVARFCNEWKSLIEKPELLLLHMR